MENKVQDYHRSSARVKILLASLILTSTMIYWIVTGVKNTSVHHFTPDQLFLNAENVDRKGVQVDGLISEGSSHWQATELKLTFAVRDAENKAKINVISTGLVRPDNFHDGGNVFVQGVYHADQNLIRATKVQTKCASKYDAADASNSKEPSVNDKATNTREGI